jgi:DNA replication protein DnaC
MTTNHRRIDLQQVRNYLQRQATTGRFKVDRYVEDIPALLRECYMDEVRKRGMGFVEDAHTVAHLAKAARWLVDTSCKPSLMLYGTFGNGKTTLARAIAKLITLLYASPYTHECKTVRIVSALKFITMCKNEPERFEQLKTAELLLIDDAGTEPSAVVKIWGNELVPFTDMIYHRYERQLFTIITSNLTMAELSSKYGERIADRFEEMFDRIPFENNSYRKLPK